MMRIPRATYRLQLNGQFRFADVQQILPYLDQLGISDIYASPIFQATATSEHLYDVTNPDRLHPALGSEYELQGLQNEMRRYGMGWLQDIVPNHMAYDRDNRWLMDVLEHGEQSPYAEFFDVDWQSSDLGQPGKIMAPFLGRHYGQSLSQGDIALEYDASGLHIRYFERKFPVRAATYLKLLLRALKQMHDEMDRDDPVLSNFLGVVYLFESVAARKSDSKHVNFDHAKKMLWRLYSSETAVKQQFDQSLAYFNGQKGNPESYNQMHRMISEQNFRLCFWKTAATEINYRRFFGLNSLIGTRMELAGVFDAWHELTLHYVDEGYFTGLRVDHIDGLYNPHAYLQRLRRRRPDIYVIVEKIMEPGERLPDDWPIQGTTGYEFLVQLNELFCQRDSEKAFSDLYDEFTGHWQEYGCLVLDAKRQAIRDQLNADFENLARQIRTIAVRDRFGQDIPYSTLKKALIEIAVHFPVYRSYLAPDVNNPDGVRAIETATERAKASNPDMQYELDFVMGFLRWRPETRPTYLRPEQLRDFVMRFQQVTGPVMAKGFEDTALYRYYRLTSLNEVGGRPDQFGSDPEQFHEFVKARMENQPHPLNATATHDTKRGEDMRARIHVLSEMPDVWKEKVHHWAELNQPYKTTVNGQEAPNRNTEYLIYQSLIGAMPFEGPEQDDLPARMERYLIKALREAKQQSNWQEPNTAYEEATQQFLHSILDATGNRTFLEDFLGFQRRIGWYGVWNSISQTVLKVAAPGTPDVYWGADRWDFSLVDPDNRRPVDFALSQRLLEQIAERFESSREELLRQMREAPADGRIKLFALWRSLQARKQFPTVFLDGEYSPVYAGGRHADRIVAFERRHGKTVTVCVATRFPAGLVEPPQAPIGPDVWSDTHLDYSFASGLKWTDWISGERVEPGKGRPLGNLFTHLPVGLLVGTE